MAKIEVFSAPDCDFCRLAKELLKSKGLAHHELDITADPAHLEEVRRRLPRSKAIPQIFIDGDHIGGYEDLCLLDERGRLDALLG